ncbi:MAG: efflux RND transporter permease subunit, partial [Pseudomonadota bacterium]
AESERWYDAPSRAVNRGLDWFKARAFRPLMGWVIRLRYPVLGAAILLLMICVEMLALGDPPWRFWTAPDRNRFVGQVAMTPSAAREDTVAQTALLREAVERVAAELEAEHGVNPVDFMLIEIGQGGGRGLAQRDDREPWQLASIGVELVDAEHRPYSSGDMARRVEEAVEMHAQAETVAFAADRSGPGEESLKIRIISEDLNALEGATQALKTALERLGPVSGVQDDMAAAEREVTLELTPLGRALGFTSESIGRILFNRLSGRTAAEFPVGQRAGKVTVALADEEITADYLARARVRAPTGEWVPLGEIVSLSSQPGYARLRRHNGRMSATVWGEVDETDPTAAAEADRLVSEAILPDIAERYGVAWRIAGLKQQEQAFLNESAIAALYALAGIYVALAWVFASWGRPLAVLLAAPFGFVGALWGHWWMGVPLSMFSIVGLIGMLGIIINDSIVLVTTIDEYARKRALAPALLDAVCDRLRPVLLTTLTTVLGLAPMLWEESEQARQLKPTIITLCFGLGCGLFVVLAVTPALAMAQRDAAAAFASLRRMRRQVWSPRRGLGRAGPERSSY